MTYFVQPSEKKFELYLCIYSMSIQKYLVCQNTRSANIPSQVDKNARSIFDRFLGVAGSSLPIFTMNYRRKRSASGFQEFSKICGFSPENAARVEFSSSIWTIDLKGTIDQMDI